MPSRHDWFNPKARYDNTVHMPPIADEGVRVELDTACKGKRADQTNHRRVAFGDTISIVAEGWILPRPGVSKDQVISIEQNVSPDLQLGFTYVVGMPNNLPRGLNEGVIGMCAGESRLLFVPLKLAYSKTMHEAGEVDYSKV